MNNEFKFDEKNGIIHYIYRGDQTAETIKEFKQQTDAIITKLRSQNKPVLMLADVNDLKKLGADARQAAVSLIQGETGDKMAIVGASTILRYTGKLVIMALGSKIEINYFDSDEQAVKWLTS